MFEEPDEVLARLEDDVRRAQQRAERLGELRSKAAEVRGVARSQRRDLVVEVDASGALTGFQIADVALERGGRRLSAEVLALSADARRDAQAKLTALTAEVIGADDPVAQSLLEAESHDDAEGVRRDWRLGVRRG